MQLLLNILMWISRKITIILFLAIMLTIAHFLWMILTPYIPGIMNWEKQRTKLTNELDRTEAKILRLEKVIAKIEQDIQNHKSTRNPPWYKPWERLKYNAEADLIALGEKLRQFRADKIEIKNKLISINDSIEGKVNKYLAMLINAFKIHFYKISYIIMIVMFGPILWKIFWFYGFANLAKKTKPLQINSSEKTGHITAEQVGKLITVEVNPENSLYLRSEHMSQYDESLHTRTRLLWNWKAPFISYAAGLFELTQFYIKRGIVKKGKVVLSSNSEEFQLAEICLKDHPGFVIHPRHIVGISGDLKVKSRWGINCLHCWLTGQLRYIIFWGTGCLYVQGRGGIQPVYVKKHRNRVEEPLVVGFDSRLAYSTVRTETFWPYLRGKVLLVDDQFGGESLYFLRQIFRDEEKGKTAFKQNFQFLSNVANAIGKFLGL